MQHSIPEKGQRRPGAAAALTIRALAQAGYKTPWKTGNTLHAGLTWPLVRLLFAWHGIPWGNEWRFYGAPIIQKHRASTMRFGDGLKLRSHIRSNPLAPSHPVFLSTWKAGALLQIGDDFAMSGGVLCATEHITIGCHVMIGANCTIVDSDFHPLQPELRRQVPLSGPAAPVQIGDDVFVGMHTLILKGVTIGAGAVVGAGSVVTADIPPAVVAAGNPACVISDLE